MRKKKNHIRKEETKSQVVGLESYVRGALWSMIITYTGYVVRGGVKVTIAPGRTSTLPDARGHSYRT